MKRLYVETNYIVGQAFSQDPVAATMIGEATKVGAALATVEMRVKRANEFSRTLQEKMRELTADRSQTAQSILTLLNQTLLENGRLANERQVRLADVFRSLSDFRFVHVDNQTTIQAVSAPIIVRGATDNLILHAIVADASTSPVGDMAFFTLNASDFAEAAVTASLASVGVVLKFNSSHVVAWLNQP